MNASDKEKIKRFLAERKRQPRPYIGRRITDGKKSHCILVIIKI